MEYSKKFFIFVASYHHVTGIKQKIYEATPLSSFSMAALYGGGAVYR
jgi:hypothetical protein